MWHKLCSLFCSLKSDATNTTAPTASTTNHFVVQRSMKLSAGSRSFTTKPDFRLTSSSITMTTPTTETRSRGTTRRSTEETPPKDPDSSENEIGKSCIRHGFRKGAIIRSKVSSSPNDSSLYIISVMICDIILTAR